MKKLISITFIKIINILVIGLSLTQVASANSCLTSNTETKTQNQTNIYKPAENLYYAPSAPQYRAAPSVVIPQTNAQTSVQYRTIPSDSHTNTMNTVANAGSNNIIQKGNTAYFYVVEKGDSLYTVTRKTNTSIKDLIHINRIPIPYTIYPGQRLYIP